MQDNFYRDSYRALLSLIKTLKANSNLPEDIKILVNETWDKLGKIEVKYDGA
jgi:hypothetical protein